jgi:hypothetical protein
MGLLSRLNDLVTELEKEKGKLRTILSSRTFSEETLHEMKREAYRKIVLKKNEIYDTEINRIKDRMNEIRKEYEYSEMSAERELLQFKKIESYIKALPDNELSQLVRDFLADKRELLEVALKPDYVNVAVSELRERGFGDLADSLHNHFFISLKGKEPYKLDPEYRELEKELNFMESYKNYTDAIMLTDGEELAPTTYYVSQELGLSDIEIPEV